MDAKLKNKEIIGKELRSLLQEEFGVSVSFYSVVVEEENWVALLKNLLLHNGLRKK